MIYKQGDVLELKDGKVCTVVQVTQRGEDYIRYYCLEGTEPPKNVPPEQWPFIGVSPDEISKKIGTIG